MAEQDAKLLKVLIGQIGQDSKVYRVLAESQLILTEAKAPQPDYDVHFKAPAIGGGAHHLLARIGCLGHSDYRFSCSRLLKRPPAAA